MNISISAGAVNVGAMLSVTVMICTWFCAGLLQSSTRDQVLVIIFEPAQSPFAILSVKVACNWLEQLSASLVTSPVADTDAS